MVTAHSDADAAVVERFSSTPFKVFSPPTRSRLTLPFSALLSDACLAAVTAYGGTTHPRYFCYALCRSIQRIGDSLKKDTSKGGKTGIQKALCSFFPCSPRGCYVRLNTRACARRWWRNKLTLHTIVRFLFRGAARDSNRWACNAHAPPRFSALHFFFFKVDSASASTASTTSRSSRRSSPPGSGAASTPRQSSCPT